ncbi:MAG TPA: hypothetical protein VFU49_08135 [Ktedonobacteraceae bacterium]|nr:hypothetical protein [Ktedonobacteraceae bacterium]
MSDVLQFPTTHMSEKARVIHNETSNLTDQTLSHIQQIQQHHASLPGSMQGPFGDFISILQQHMSNGQSLREQIGTLLGNAAHAASGTDGSIADSFTGFENSAPH